MNKKHTFLYVALVFFTVTLIRSETPGERKLRKHIYKNKLVLTAENKNGAIKIINTHVEKCKKKLESYNFFLVAIFPYCGGVISILSAGIGVVQVAATKGLDGKTLTLFGLAGLSATYQDKIGRDAKVQKLTHYLERDNELLTKLNSIQE